MIVVCALVVDTKNKPSFFRQFFNQKIADLLHNFSTFETPWNLNVILRRFFKYRELRKITKINLFRIHSIISDHVLLFQRHKCFDSKKRRKRQQQPSKNSEKSTSGCNQLRFQTTRAESTLKKLQC